MLDLFLCFIVSKLIGLHRKKDMIKTNEELKQQLLKANYSTYLEIQIPNIQYISLNCCLRLLYDIKIYILPLNHCMICCLLIQFYL